MRKLSIVESVTLDGVMQAPGRPDEDRRGGFEHGGWAAPYSDETMGREMAKGMGSTSLLLGRRTYEQFYDFWPKQTDGNPFTDVLNNARKYVASTTLDEPLPWQNSTLLDGDAGDSVAALKAEPGDDLLVLGSGQLVQTLLQRGLIDEFVLMIHPLVLGTGARLFRHDEQAAKLRLENTVPTATGVIIATYRPN
jgi:dihydrofolate reductase